MTVPKKSANFYSLESRVDFILARLLNRQDVHLPRVRGEVVLIVLIAGNH